MKKSEDIIVKSFNGIGDLLFVTPTLRVIKEAYPEVKITVNTNYPELLEGNPFVDKVGRRKDSGVFLGYADPIHGEWPTEHHIIEDWKIVCSHYGLETERPALQPEIYMDLSPGKVSHNGVQVIHKGHWHRKKVWPKFRDLLDVSGFIPIPKFPSVVDLVKWISFRKAVVCSEGGISHIARALGVPAVVIFGGFADPEWNGYEDQINICNDKWCSYCYNTQPCQNKVERLCMKEITINQVLRAVGGLDKIDELSVGNAKQFTEERAKFWCKGEGIDVGGGKWPFEGARVISDGAEENAYSIKEKRGSLDFVFSSHCIEHLESPGIAIEEWIRVLKAGGILYLYFPHPDYIPWRKESMPRWHKHNLHVHDIISIVDNLSFCEVIEIVQKDHWFGQTVIVKKI